MKKLFVVFLSIYLILAGCNNSDPTELSDQQNQINSLSEELKEVNSQFENATKDINSNDKTNEQLSMIKNDLTRLETEIKEKDKKIQELERKVESNWINLNQKENEIYMVEQLVMHLPNVTRKEGYIKEVIEENMDVFFLIDYATMIHNDGYSPNNFHIENQKEEYIKVKAVNDVELYFRDGTLTQGPWYITNEQFDKELKRYERFFDLYFIDDKLVLVVERYLP